jgi:hypothetical protein
MSNFPSDSKAPFRLAVLNPGGADVEQSFADFAGTPGTAKHAPINYHAYAACTGGSFHRKVETIFERTPGDQMFPVLLLLRKDLKGALKALRRLRQLAGKQASASQLQIAISLKEAGGHQVAALLNDPHQLGLFKTLCAEADFCLASTPELVPFYKSAGASRAGFIPTPYPVDIQAWNFSLPWNERQGVFIGTREFDTPSRNHLAALMSVQQLDTPVTVMNPDGRVGLKKLAALGFKAGHLRIIEGRMRYADYLQIIAQHRLVFQLDRSAVPGQVAGDALLCRVPCVGGDGALERIAFPDLCGHGREPAALIKLAGPLLFDDACYAQAIEASQTRAAEELSFKSGAVKLRQLWSSKPRVKA